MHRNNNKEAVEKIRRKIRRLWDKSSEEDKLIEVSYANKSENTDASLLIANK